MEKISILITGDFCSINRVANLVDEGKHDEVFNDFTGIITKSDITVTNLEAPLLSEGEKIEKTGPNIKASEKTADFLKTSGFDIATLANNHILDYGYQGLKNTMALCENAGLMTVGAGLTKTESNKILYVKIKGKKIAILNFCQNEWSTEPINGAIANEIDPINNRKDILRAKADSDFVLVITHSGNEGFSYPTPWQKKLFRYYVDVGADVVVNHHTHCVSGYEIYNGKPIFYSLGNFVFDIKNPVLSNWNYGLAVNFLISENEIDFELCPFIQNYNKVGVHLLKGDEKNSFLTQLNTINAQILDDSELSSIYDTFVNKQKRMYIGFIQPYSNRYIHKLRNIGYIPNVWNKKKRKLLYNLIRCEAHKDILLEILKKIK